MVLWSGFAAVLFNHNLLPSKRKTFFSRSCVQIAQNISGVIRLLTRIVSDFEWNAILVYTITFLWTPNCVFAGASLIFSMNWSKKISKKFAHNSKKAAILLQCRQHLTNCAGDQTILAEQPRLSIVTIISDLTQGFHRNLHQPDSTREGALLTVGNAIREEGARRLMSLAAAAYQQRIRTCLMSLHARSVTNNNITSILKHADLRIACNGVLWKDGVRCLQNLHTFCCGSVPTCTLGHCPRINLDSIPEYFKPVHWVGS